MLKRIILSILLLANLSLASFEPLSQEDLARLKEIAQTNKQFTKICDLYYAVELAKELKVPTPKLVLFGFCLVLLPRHVMNCQLAWTQWKMRSIPIKC